MKKILTLVMCVLALSFIAKAQDKPTEPANKVEPETAKTEPKTAQKLTAKDYEDLLAKLKAGDMTIDFAKLRLAYTETKNYSPYGGSDTRNEMFKLLNEDKYKDALKIAEKMLETNYVDLHSHFIAAASNKELKNDKQAEFHLNVFKGLMNAITENDGLTAKTAMISIGISEQYFVMSILGFERKMKALTNENGSMFDVHTAENPETKETRKFYFNIDKVFGKF